MLGRARDEHAKLLNRRDDDLRVRVAELRLKYLGRGVGICRALLEPIVLFYGLVVKVAPVDDKQHLLDAIHLRGENRRLERGQGLAASSRVPDIPAAARRTFPAVVAGYAQPRDYTLGRGNLVGAHHE